MNQLDDDIKSMRSQKSKQIQTALNGKGFTFINRIYKGLRRARLRVGCQQLNIENLKSLNQFDVIKETAEEQQSKTEAQNPQQNILDQSKDIELNDTTIELDKQEITLDNIYKLSPQCLICEKFMNENDSKVSQRLEDYFKDRNEIDKVIQRIKSNISSKMKDSLQQREIMIEHESLSMIACFRCMYDMILSNEGRSVAMRIFHVAHMQMQNEQHAASAQALPRSLGPNKKRVAHDNSFEMSQLGLFKGTFYDYKKQNEESIYDNISPGVAKNLSNAVIKGRYQRSHQSVLISLPRENSTHHTNQINNTFDQSTTTQTFTNSKLRVWREDFNDKVERKFGSLANQERQQKILKKIEKDRLKYMLGMKMHNENQALMRQYKSEQNNLIQKSIICSNQQLPMHSEIIESNNTAIEPIQIDIQSSKKSINLNKNLTSTNQTYYTSNNQKKIDKTFFRKISNLGAFANASFNAGVYINPPEQHA